MGGIAAVVLIQTSQSYSYAKEFLITDKSISNEFGQVKFFFSFSATEKNAVAYYGFYIFGEKKNAATTMKVVQRDNNFIVERTD
jgi:hypothetical protein